jgi:hypothetical protein
VDEARAEILASLYATAGATGRAADLLGCSAGFFVHLANRVGLRGEAKRIRELAASRFRLPLSSELVERGDSAA